MSELSPRMASPSSSDASSSDSNTVFPDAIVENASTSPLAFQSRLWWLTVICALISLSLFWYAKQGSGGLIAIEFRDGFGLKPEDRLKYHGIDVGTVERMELNKGSNGVLVHVRMTPQTRQLAGEGARFWIVRPSISLESVQGLDTILGAKYIAIEPSPVGAKPVSQFNGLELPPILSPREGSLEITLDASTRGGLENSAPILYRGFCIGHVIQVGLASDARTVQARCAIYPEFRDLVRTNSRFWNRSGWRLDVGLSGIKLDADTLAQMISGGIEIATPTEPGGNVSTGHRFTLNDKPETEWSTWRPSLTHGEAWNRIASKMPQPIRLALRWQERSYGFRKNQQRTGWCLPLSDGTVICLSEQIVAPSAAFVDSAITELAGLSLPTGKLQVPGVPVSTSDPLSSPTVLRFSLADPLPSDINLWSISSIAEKLPAETSDIFIAHPDPKSVLAIDAARLSVSEDGWILEDSVHVDREYHGLPVVSAESGQVVGFVTIRKEVRIVINILANR